MKKKGGIIAAIIAAIMAIFSYYTKTQYNPITDEKQRVSISVEQEIALGQQSAPQMIQQHGGLHPNQEAQRLIKAVGKKLVNNTAAKETAYQYDFHLLADPEMVNAFALPGGQIFITQALFGRLKTEDQLAGVLGHEIGHVVARHSAERIAQQELAEGLKGAAVIATYDPNNPNAGQMEYLTTIIGNLVTMKYGREQELESDDLGVRFMIEAGYKPEALIGVMEILKEAAGGRSQSEFFSTHPNPENRVEKIQEAIKKYQRSS